MMDPVGVTSLVYEVSKDLYTYYRVLKHCDADIKELRAQLLWLQQASEAITSTLARDGVKAEDVSQVNEAASRCTEAAEELREVLDKIRVDGPQSQTVLEKLKTAGRKAVYPFKKSTIAGLAENAETCQDALHAAIALLHLNVGATTREQLQKLDDKIVDGVKTLEAALQDMKLSSESAQDEVIQQLQHHRKLLEDEKERKKAEAIIDTLAYPEMFDRRRAIPNDEYASLDWLFTAVSQEYSQLTDLKSFLSLQSGLFWIQGKPASGKSTLMKFLLDHTRGKDKLWEWSGTKEVHFASHFCWIAGTHMQKSQQGLLQSLLYQLLLSDLALVPIACPSRWDANVSRGSWYEKELWDSIFAAVSANDKRVCFIIDGLDEIEPETSHRTLAAAIYRLSSCGNVKMIASSRPWPDFERAFHRAEKVVAMEKVNRLSIVHYVRSRLTASAVDESFSSVAWSCMRSGNCRDWMSEHRHGDAHSMVASIISRADGVFLWTSLIMNAVCRHIAMSCPVSVLRSYVHKLPGELEVYFRDMIFNRIDKSSISETAMILTMALIGKNTLAYFSLLCDYTDKGVSQLEDPDFLERTIQRTCTATQLKIRSQNTLKFLRTCCVDMLDFTKVDEDPTSFHGSRFYQSTITFTHRTMFDFLSTSDMQKLLTRYIPAHFKEDCFALKLTVAGWALLATDLEAPSSDIILGCCFDVIADSFPERPKQMPRRLVGRLEGMAVYYTSALSSAGALWALKYDKGRVIGEPDHLVAEFARYRLYNLADALVTLPELLQGPSCALAVKHPNMIDRRTRLGRAGDYGTDTTLLLRLLQAGADPDHELNMDLGYFDWENRPPKSTVWRTFLQRLDHCTASRKGSMAHGSDADLRQDPLEGGIVAEKEQYSHSHIQTAIKLMIEFGAELDIAIANKLRARLPLNDDHNWQCFLNTYLQPEKRQELRIKRRRRIAGWSERGWSNADRLLFGLAPKPKLRWSHEKGVYILQDPRYRESYGCDDFDLWYQERQDLYHLS